MSHNANLYAILASGFPADRNTVAIETPSRQYSYGDIEQTSARLAAYLASLGMAPGERVLVQVEKSPEALMFYLGVLRAGFVYMPLNTAYREAEVAYFLNDARPSLIVCDASNCASISALAHDNGGVRVETLNADGSGTLCDAAQGFEPAFTTVDTRNDDLGVILYTSGTTGRSKGAMLSHRNMASNAQVLHQYWGWQSSDVLLHMLPIFHVHGLFVAAHGVLLAGARMIWLPRLDIEQALYYLPRCTVMMGVPTYYVRLLAQPEFGREHCKSMRLFVSGSAPLLQETFDTFQQRTGHFILERYGMSETVMLTSNPYSPEDGPRLGGTVGRPLPGVSVRITNDVDQALPDQEIGHVQVRGENVFSGYWQMPDKTRESFTDDGWFRTGDVGHWNNQGYLVIVGRSKDLIISGGYNVYPKEIELMIDEMPGVSESAVVGVPHPDFGEAVVAVVVPQSGVMLDPIAIQRQLKASIANFKVPKQVHIISELPRNTMGKVQKNVLRERYQAS
ncbi:malonyl-CoA synthase [Pusillimonas sp. DMV24BSW_D]|uniref:malonate--CoA ligase n=1 Tax=Neopusillimonas aestuarii TaxID=2716226 RepID=UPI0014095632|nr:malonyl-CoA synthase [Pusillimonas sp. DMV24BSW_D]QIM47759.1 malonyl-CoA synthase [Pusillimonas sp. DMV24BSW_D]